MSFVNDVNHTRASDWSSASLPPPPMSSDTATTRAQSNYYYVELNINNKRQVVKMQCMDIGPASIATSTYYVQTRTCSFRNQETSSVPSNNTCSTTLQTSGAGSSQSNASTVLASACRSVLVIMNEIVMQQQQQQTYQENDQTLLSQVANDQANNANDKNSWDLNSEFARLILEHDSKINTATMSVGDIQSFKRMQNACQLTRAWTLYAYVCECYVHCYESAVNSVEIICHQILSNETITDFLLRCSFDISCGVRMLTLLYIDKILTIIADIPMPEYVTRFLSQFEKFADFLLRPTKSESMNDNTTRSAFINDATVLTLRAMYRTQLAKKRMNSFRQDYCQLVDVILSAHVDSLLSFGTEHNRPLRIDFQNYELQLPVLPIFIENDTEKDPFSSYRVVYGFIRHHMNAFRKDWTKFWINFGSSHYYAHNLHLLVESTVECVKKTLYATLTLATVDRPGSTDQNTDSLHSSEVLRPIDSSTPNHVDSFVIADPQNPLFFHETSSITNKDVGVYIYVKFDEIQNSVANNITLLWVQILHLYKDIDVSIFQFPELAHDAKSANNYLKRLQTQRSTDHQTFLNTGDLLEQIYIYISKRHDSMIRMAVAQNNVCRQLKKMSVSPKQHVRLVLDDYSVCDLFTYVYGYAILYELEQMNDPVDFAKSDANTVQNGLFTSYLCASTNNVSNSAEIVDFVVQDTENEENIHVQSDVVRRRHGSSKKYMLTIDVILKQARRHQNEITQQFLEYNRKQRNHGIQMQQAYMDIIMKLLEPCQQAWFLKSLMYDDDITSLSTNYNHETFSDFDMTLGESSMSSSSTNHVSKMFVSFDLTRFSCRSIDEIVESFISWWPLSDQQKYNKLFALEQPKTFQDKHKEERMLHLYAKRHFDIIHQVGSESVWINYTQTTNIELKALAQTLQNTYTSVNEMGVVMGLRIASTLRECNHRNCDNTRNEVCCHANSTSTSRDSRQPDEFFAQAADPSDTEDELRNKQTVSKRQCIEWKNTMSSYQSIRANVAAGNYHRTRSGKQQQVQTIQKSQDKFDSFEPDSSSSFMAINCMTSYADIRLLTVTPGSAIAGFAVVVAPLISDETHMQQQYLCNQTHKYKSITSKFIRGIESELNTVLNVYQDHKTKINAVDLSMIYFQLFRLTLASQFPLLFRSMDSFRSEHVYMMLDQIATDPLSVRRSAIEVYQKFRIFFKEATSYQVFSSCKQAVFYGGQPDVRYAETSLSFNLFSLKITDKIFQRWLDGMSLAGNVIDMIDEFKEKKYMSPQPSTNYEKKSTSDSSILRNLFDQFADPLRSVVANQWIPRNMMSTSLQVVPWKLHWRQIIHSTKYVKNMQDFRIQLQSFLTIHKSQLTAHLEHTSFCEDLQALITNLHIYVNAVNVFKADIYELRQKYFEFCENTETFTQGATIEPIPKRNEDRQYMSTKSKTFLLKSHIFVRHEYVSYALMHVTLTCHLDAIYCFLQKCIDALESVQSAIKANQASMSDE